MKAAGCAIVRQERRTVSLNFDRLGETRGNLGGNGREYPIVNLVDLIGERGVWRLGVNGQGISDWKSGRLDRGARSLASWRCFLARAWRGLGGASTSPSPSDRRGVPDSVTSSTLAESSIHAMAAGYVAGYGTSVTHTYRWQLLSNQYTHLCKSYLHHAPERSPNACGKPHSNASAQRRSPTKPVQIREPYTKAPRRPPPLSVTKSKRFIAQTRLCQLLASINRMAVSERSGHEHSDEQCEASTCLVCPNSSILPFFLLRFLHHVAGPRCPVCRSLSCYSSSRSSSVFQLLGSLRWRCCNLNCDRSRVYCCFSVSGSRCGGRGW